MALTADSHNFPREAVAASLFSAPLWVFAYGVGNAFVCCLAATAGAFLSIRWFLRLLKYPLEFVHLMPVSAIALVAILNTGFLLSWILSTVGLNRDFVETFNFLGVSFSSYASAIFYVMLFCGVLAACGMIPQIRHLETRLKGKLLALKLFSTNSLVFMVFLAVLIDIFAIATGIIGFRSINTEGAAEGRLAWFLPFLQTVFAVQVPLNAALVARVWSRRHGLSLLPACCLGISFPVILYISFTTGRSAIVLCLSLHFLYWCMFLGRRPSLKVLTVLAVLFFAVVPQVLALNNFMRTQKNTRTSQFANASSFEAVVGMSEAYQGSKNARQLETKVSLDNLSRRPLVATPLAKCLAMDPRVKTFMLGINVQNSFVWAIPRVLFPSKVRYSVMEGLLFRYFPDRSFLGDIADSAYLYSYTDFGWLGIVLYPLILALLWFIVLLILNFLHTSLACWFVFATWPAMFLLSIGEGSMTGWFFTLRDSLMFGGILFLFEVVFCASKRKPSLPSAMADRLAQ